MKRRRLATCLTAALALGGGSGCGSLEGNVAAGAGGATALAARAPTHEIEQTYYLGVFDPEEQVPPALYRVRVNGQSSSINDTEYSSGWVPAYIADSLGSNIGFDRDTSQLTIDEGAERHQVTLKTGRRLMLFGPEGFREAPADHRLVIVMGSNPDDYFNALSEVLGDLGEEVARQRTAPDRDRAAVGAAFIAADDAIEKSRRHRERADALLGAAGAQNGEGDEE